MGNRISAARFVRHGQHAPRQIQDLPLKEVFDDDQRVILGILPDRDAIVVCSKREHGDGEARLILGVLEQPGVEGLSRSNPVSRNVPQGVAARRPTHRHLNRILVPDKRDIALPLVAVNYGRYKDRPIHRVGRGDECAVGRPAGVAGAQCQAGASRLSLRRRCTPTSAAGKRCSTGTAETACRSTPSGTSPRCSRS